MKEINDFERTTLIGLTIPLHLGAHIFARKCTKCDKALFVNYKGHDYECHSCRGIDIRDFKISSKHS